MPFIYTGGRWPAAIEWSCRLNGKVCMHLRVRGARKMTDDLMTDGASVFCPKPQGVESPVVLVKSYNRPISIDN